jgi:hypothetical protein
MKLKRVSSEERLVMDLAADTIKQGLRASVNGYVQVHQVHAPSLCLLLLLVLLSSIVPPICLSKKRRKQPNGRPPLGADLDQPYSLSNTSIASQVTLSEIDPLEAPAPISPSPVSKLSTSSSSSLILKIQKIEAIKLKIVKWNGYNDPYLVITSGQHWRYETEVIWNAAHESVSWSLDDMILGRNGLLVQSNDELSIEVYSANFVRDDQLIGRGKLVLADVVHHSPQIVTVELVNEQQSQSNPPPQAGLLSFHLIIEEEEEEETLTQERGSNVVSKVLDYRNSHNQQKKQEAKQQQQQSSSVSSSSSSSPSVNSKSQTKRPPNDLLKQNKSESLSKVVKETKSILVPVPVVAEGKQKRSLGKPQPLEEKKGTKGIQLTIHSRDEEEEEDKDQEKDLKHSSETKEIENNDQRLKQSSRPKSALGRVSKSTGDGVQPDRDNRVVGWEEEEEEGPTMSVGISTKEGSRSKKLILQSKNSDLDNEMKRVKSPHDKKKKKQQMIKSNAVTPKPLIDHFIAFNLNEVDITPDMHHRVVDQALEIAIQEEASSITLHTNEVALVLNALDIPLVPDALLPSSSSQPIKEIRSSQQHTNPTSSNSSSTKSFVLLSLHHPALMASSLTEYSLNQHLIHFKSNTSTSTSRQQQFVITESQSMIIIKQLVFLIYGPWKQCREIILSACQMKVAYGGGRPSYWTSIWIQKLILILQLPLDKFHNYNGDDFLSLDHRHLDQYIKSSILRVRCRVYIKILLLLDSWWDEKNNIETKNITRRPNDILRDRNRNSDPVSVGTTRLTRGAGTGTGAGAGAGAGTGDKEIKKKQTKKPTSSSSSSSSIIIFKDGDCVKLSLYGNLLSAYLPIQRAYGWKITSEEMIAMTEVLSNCIGHVSLHPPYGTNRLEIPEMTWIEFQDEFLTLVTKESECLYQLLREYEMKKKIELISGRCVLVPTSCLMKCHPRELLQQQQLQQPKVRDLSDVPLDEILIGMKICVQPLEVMCKAYEKYDWWDRPSVAVLQNFANKSGIIISTSSVSETGRVGVSIHIPNSPDVVDALPLGALILLPSSVPKSSSSSSSELHQNPLKEKTKSKVMKNNKKPSPELINENIVLIQRTPSASQEPLFQKRVVLSSSESQRTKRPNSAQNLSSSRKISQRAVVDIPRSNLHDDDDDDDELLIDEPTAGDESAPPDFDLREEMVKDSRITTPKPISSVTLNQSNSRPLYRPLTTFNLLNTTTTSPTKQEIDQPPRYDWMRNSLAPEPQKISHVTEDHPNDSNPTRPKLSTATFDFEGAAGLFDNKVPLPNHKKQNISRPKTTLSSRELYSKKIDDSLITDRVSLSAELDMFIDGTRFGRKDQQIKPHSSHTSTPSPPKKNKTMTPSSSSTRPSSAGPRSTRNRSDSVENTSQSHPSTRRPSTSTTGGGRGGGGLSSSVKGSLKTQTHDLLRELHLDGDDGEAEDLNTTQRRKYDERMKRDIKRTENEIKRKEAALKRQVKRYGVDLDAYDAYHEV